MAPSAHEVLPIPVAGSRCDVSPDPSDASIAAVLRSGDAQAFEELCRTFSPRLHRLARTMVGDDAAGDLSQDVLVRIWERGGSFDPTRGNFSSWVWAIARNAATDHHRSASRRREAEQSATADGTGDASSPQERDVVARQSAQEIRDALARLEPDQRRVLWSAFWMDRSHSQIAGESGVPLGTVKSRIRAGLNHLRAGLVDPAPA